MIQSCDCCLTCGRSWRPHANIPGSATSLALCLCGRRYRTRTIVATVAFRASRGRPKTLIVARRAEAELAYHDG
jgi:hypothetical protein